MVFCTLTGVSVFSLMAGGPRGGAGGQGAGARSGRGGQAIIRRRASRAGGRGFWAMGLRGGRGRTALGLPPPHGPLDDADGLGHRFILGHRRIVQHHRILRGAQGGFGAAAVARVAGGEVGFDFREGDGAAPPLFMVPLHLGQAAAGAGLHAGDDKKLGRRLRGDDSADVAPVQHRAAGLAGKGALALEQGGAHRGMHRNAAGKAATGLAA